MSNNALVSSKRQLSILQTSPLDARPPAPDAALPVSTRQHWVPSRYNIRATTDDGRLVLWNTLSGGMVAFPKESVAQVTSLLAAAGFESETTGLPGYLVEKGFLVRRGTDEYRKFLHAFGKQHYQTDRLELILMASEDCNFRCTYCYEAFKRGTMRPEVIAGLKRMIEERIERLSVLVTSWFGGEPLYGFAAIEQLAPFFMEIAGRHGTHYSSYMTTNGYLLTPDIVDRLFAWRVNNFQITLDGAPKDHDCSRPARDGSGTFWRILENLSAMSRRTDEFFVGVRVNFGPSNAPGMSELFDHLQTQLRGDSRFKLAFHPVGHLGGENDANIAVCTEDESLALATQMKALALARGLGTLTVKQSNYLGGQVCYAARPFNLLVGATGKVMKCTVVLDTMENNIVGQLGADGELVLNEENMALWTEPTFARDQQCQRCVALPSCQGISCPLPRIRRNVRPCVPTRTHGKDELKEMLRQTTFRPRTLEGAPR